MKFSEGHAGREREIVGLFEATFFAAEGYLEGSRVGDIARGLMDCAAIEELFVFTAESGGALVGAVAFSRLVFFGDDRSVFILSPMAVAVASQGRGVGQGLIRHGFDALRDSGVDVVLTYGDPRFYAKLGFSRISTEIVPPPYPLSQPDGWQGLSLTDRELTPLAGPSICAMGLDNPLLW